MSANLIELWHKRARPNPTAEDFAVQVGCHVEEFAEMLGVLTTSTDSSTRVMLRICQANAIALADHLKHLAPTLRVDDRKEFLDSLADQIVTAIGAGYCLGVDVPEGLRRVNSSNWSKFVDGQPLFDSNGKVKKGPNYAPPDLTGLFEGGV